jgi:TRAP-type C4-dicarboxylate transport system permease small subunit
MPGNGFKYPFPGINFCVCVKEAVKQFIHKIFDVLEIHLPVLIFFLLIISVVVQVFARYVLNHPLPKLFELSIYSFVWVIYLGAVLAKRYNQHIRFDIIYRRFPQKMRLLVDIFFDVLTSSIFIFILIPSIKYTAWAYRIKASALRIPWTYLLLCFPIFLCLIIIHNLSDIVGNIRELLGKESPRQEELPWQ